MKRYSKKKFKEITFKEIEKLNYEELQNVKKGLKVLYTKIRDNTDALNLDKTNDLGYFLHQVMVTIVLEEMKRRMNEEVPY